MTSAKKYIDVILPLPVEGVFTYAVPDEWTDKIRLGMRVAVPFGKKKIYTGIIYLIHSVAPQIYQAKEIISILDNEPVLRYPQLKFWEWIADYYQSNIGDVYKASVPAGLKLESETLIHLNPDYEAEEVLSRKEQKILDFLSADNPVKVSELSKATEIRELMPALKTLLEKNAIEIHENIAEKYKSKTETYIRLTPSAQGEDNLRALFEILNRAKKQLEALMHFIDISKCLTNEPIEVNKKDFLQQTRISLNVLNSLAEKNIIEFYKKETARLENSTNKIEELFPLNSFQQEAYRTIKKQFEDKQVVLLHGITSSGKTEIYIHLIQKAIAEGKQVLYLVPEIALTTQLTSRLKRVFGNKLGVYHSKFSDAERVEIWDNVLHDKGYEVIIGVRSSVFLPFRKLGLVIVDEEHETSYKQFDPAPRYHARNSAIVLANMHGAKTLLGTATPAIETYFNAQTGKYGLVELNKRFEEIELPEITVVDLKEAYRKKQMENHFTPALLDAISEALQNQEQVILFQNRRGYAPYIECKACGYIPKCEHCDVSLTYHKSSNILSCHYCGYTTEIPALCPVCKKTDIRDRGFGTEKVEDEIQTFFPDARIRRMDLDTTRSKKGYENIIRDFEDQKVDILVGTQMITKGLDFENVSLVGILNADNLLNFPDFRSHERAFQLMEQVSGRAGRRGKRGKVILQTSSPEHPVINQVLRHNYEDMFNTQCTERKLFHYPPYYRLIQIAVRHKDSYIVSQASEYLAEEMRKAFGNRILGPNNPLVSRIKSVYIKHILLKIELESPVDKAKDIINQLIKQTHSIPQFKSVWINLDIDPM